MRGLSRPSRMVSRIAMSYTGVNKRNRKAGTKSDSVGASGAGWVNLASDQALHRR
jgi:hypothetical protein